MTKRTVLRYWACVIGIQVTGLAMFAFGGTLDDPLKLLGWFVLLPGMMLVWGWAARITTEVGAWLLLGAAVAINLAIAGAIHLGLQHGEPKISN